VELETETGYLFTGREQVLRELATWIRGGAIDARARIVTGDPGSGKSAVLGRLVLLADPEYGPSVPAVSPETMPPEGQSTSRCTRAAKPLTSCPPRWPRRPVQAESPGQLLEALASVPRRPLIAVIDALDEAADPIGIATGLLRPLAAGSARSQLRLLIGARRHMLAHLADEDTSVVLDLDAPPYLDRADVVAYARRCLLDPDAPASPYLGAPSDLVDAVAQAVADAAGQTFLLARLVARALARRPSVVDPTNQAWRRDLPTTAGAAMQRDLERLGADFERARDLLVPLAYAEGAGMPWEDLWALLASTIADRHYTNDDIRWLRAVAGAYITESREHGRSTGCTTRS
jgi:hypothetical protein